MKNPTPHNPPAEEAVIGACLLNRNAILDVVELVTPDDFYNPTWAAVMTAMRSLLVEGGIPIDPITVTERCRTLGLGVPNDLGMRLIDAQANTPTSDPTRHATYVADDATKRRVQRAAIDMRALAESAAPAADVVDGAESMLFDIATRSRTSSTLRRIDELIPARLDAVEARYLDDASIIDGLPTGFADLDNKLLGLRPGQLVTIGARPGMGKTAFALNIATHVARQARPVLFFSLEMSGEEVTDRLLSSLAGVPLQSFATGKLSDASWKRLHGAVSELSALPIDVDDNPALTVLDIRAKARRVKAARKGLGLIVVDYVQLMGAGAGARYENRQALVSEISRSLKVLAREIDCPVVALVQLNRELEKRFDKRPQLADIRESGSVEQDSNVVLFLYRDEVYDDESRDKGVAEVIIAKNRSGPTGKVRLTWQGEYTRFLDLAGPPAWIDREAA